MLLADEYYETDSYEDSGDIEDLSVLTDDSKRIKMSAAGAQMQPAASNAYLKGFKEKILGDQIERYEKIRRVHMTFRLNGYDSPQGVRALARAEAIVK